MATFQPGSINVPAGDVADLQAALAAEFAGSVLPNPTLLQLAEAKRLRDVAWLIRLVKNYRKANAVIVTPVLT